MSEASLLVVQGADQGTRFVLDVPQLVLGRSATCDLRINDHEASRRHARIHEYEGRWYVSDLGSSNGTYINGRGIKQQQLKVGDQLQVGRTILLFHTEEAPRTSGVHQRIRLVQDSAQDGSQIVGTVPRTGPAALDASASFVAGLQAGASLQALYQIAEEVVRPMATLDQTLQRILELTLEAVGADRGCMLVTNPRSDLIEPRIVCQRPGLDTDTRMPISKSIVEYVIRHGQGVRTSNAAQDSRFERGESIVRAGILEALCVPMTGRYELMGVIYVDTTSSASAAWADPGSASRRTRFNDQLLNLLQTISRQSALVIENQRYQQALVEAERLGAMGQTIATMSHHVKNILQGVRGGGYLVDSGLKEQNLEQIGKGWGIVNRNLDRIYNLVMDMLQFSKERQPDPQPNHLNTVVEDVCELVASRIADRQIDCRHELMPGIPEALFDAEAIHRALLNIVTNAIDAVEQVEEPRIVIRAGYDPAAEQLWISVDDNGPGIPEEELPRMFHLFSSTKGSRGTGLGLAVTRKILHEHGGDITAENRPEGGARFRLYWPFVPDEAEEVRIDRTLSAPPPPG
jgi:signal transduction histidine kinase